MRTKVIVLALSLIMSLVAIFVSGFSIGMSTATKMFSDELAKRTKGK